MEEYDYLSLSVHNEIQAIEALLQELENKDKEIKELKEKNSIKNKIVKQQKKQLPFKKLLKGE